MTSKTFPARRNWLAGLVVFVALAAGFAAFHLMSAKDRSTALTPEPARSEPMDSAATDPQPVDPQPPARAVPDTLPDITLADRHGKPTPLSSFGNRPLMVNFWATWCAPCRREIPLLNRLRAERQASQNAEIVGIAVDFREDVLEFVKKVPLTYPLLIGEEDGLAAADAFGMGMALPFSVFLDSQNRILTVKVGELHEDEANFVFDRIRDVDDGRVSRETAQSQVAEAFREMAARRANESAHAAPAVEK